MTAQLIELRPRTVRPLLTNVRYQGSIPELRGRRGWVEQVRNDRGELRYDISLMGHGGRPATRLVQVCPDSLVID